MGFARAGGHRLHYAREGAGPVRFLCLHGLVDDLAVWDRLVPGLAERGGVLRFDQRGHGRSEAPPGPCTRSDLARDALAVLDAAGTQRALWIGHSMGGVVALQAALDHPERVAGLVLIGSTAACSERVAAWYERIARAGEREGCEGLARAIYGDRPRPVRGDAAGIARVTRMLASLHADPLAPRLSRVRCPALVMVGEEDPMGARPSELLAAGIPRARLLRAPAGHWVHVEAPEAVLAGLDDWEGIA